MTVLVASDLCLQAGRRQLLDRLDLEIRPGQCWALLGPNGSGKTTLLHTLAGLRPPQGGHVTLDGHALDELPRRHVARLIGLLPQDDFEAFPASILEQVLSGRHPHLGRWQWETAEDHALARRWIDALGLAGLEHRLLHTLSGGERRRVAIATLLTQETGLLLLDEPGNHLDLAHQIGALERIAGLTADARRPRGVIMSLHDINLASRFCSHVLLLFGDGRHLAGRLTDVLTRENLEALYQHPFHSVTVTARRYWIPA